jgi:hypothetical protein
MTTDTITPVRQATPADNQPTDPTRLESPVPAAPRSPVDTPRRRKRGAGRLLRSLIPSDDRQALSDHLLILGPSGGPLWASRVL